VIVGGGKMGEALAVGMAAAGRSDFVVVEPARQRRDALNERFAVVAAVADAVGSTGAGSTGPLGAVIAVKPNHVRSVCADLVGAGATRVLSIAAGVTLAALQEWLPGVAVLRAMPNTAALVGAAASALSAGERVGDEERAWAREILSAVGTVVDLEETSLDAVTGLSGSGPAYVFLVVEALIDAGVLVGLPRDIAAALAVQTLLGSARLLAETGEEPSALRAAVTSPGGTTAAGLLALERGGVRAALLEAVSASAERASALGRTAPGPA
jgi:pyrroline-5-carboxylate reductase